MLPVLCFLALSPGASHATGPHSIVPAVKQWTDSTASLDLSVCRIADHPADLTQEAAILTDLLHSRSIRLDSAGASIKLELGELQLPPTQSLYADAIRSQAYSIRVDADGVLIRGPTRVGVFYGIQTFRQLISNRRTAPHVDILDWPDLPFRGIMVDPARANENADYYRSLIEFCARYKLNLIHLHLTDDQGVTLHHDDYAPVMHPFASKPDAIKRLMQDARRYYIQIMPEIESLGHARIFLNHPDYKDFLHQTESNRPPGSWVGTTRPGYTNVLCPASERAAAYLEDMYDLCADLFLNPIIHVGCDEVDMTRCSRCVAAFGEISPVEWFRRHLLHCRALAPRHMRIAVWGDMLLRYPEILDGLSQDDFLIYDWHYNADVSDKSVRVFREKLFQVVACPALVCHPRMILPNADNFTNIRRFAEIARKHDLRGIDTTIWIPTRYLSDALWTGIAFAAAHSWAGGNWNEAEFYRRFVADFFGSDRGDDFAAVWKRIGAIDWDLHRFRSSCWFDDESLADAKEKLPGIEADATRQLAELQSAAGMLATIRPTVTANKIAWDAFEHSVAILAYTIEHFLAAARLGRDPQHDRETLRELDAACAAALGWIEADWDRNRFADDPGKADLHNTGQHLLHRFHQMQEYHAQLLADLAFTQPADAP